MALGVSEGAVSQWLKRGRAGGREALNAHPPKGVAPRLSAEQKAQIPTLLAKGVQAYGFRGEVWTARRVAEVIEKKSSVQAVRGNKHFKREERRTNVIAWRKIGTVPEETIRIAKASFPHGNRSMRLRDLLGTIFEDSEFADLFSRRGQPAETPWRVGLVCLIQYLEDLDFPASGRCSTCSC